MPAYIISDVEVKDPELIEIYRSRAAASIALHGGRYIVRGGTVECLEGDWTPKLLVIAEFPDMERARAWYRSPRRWKSVARHSTAISSWRMAWRRQNRQHQGSVPREMALPFVARGPFAQAGEGFVEHGDVPIRVLFGRVSNGRVGDASVVARFPQHSWESVSARSPFDEFVGGRSDRCRLC